MVCLQGLEDPWMEANQIQIEGLLRNRYFSATHKGLPYGRVVFGMAYGVGVF